MRRRLTHGVIGNTTDFGSAESWFEPRWVNTRPAEKPASVFCVGPEAGPADWPLLRQLADHRAFSLRSVRFEPRWVNTRPAEKPASVFCVGPEAGAAV